jgi:D-alanyl-D-alanine carboxypeptidase
MGQTFNAAERIPGMRTFYSAALVAVFALSSSMSAAAQTTPPNSTSSALDTMLAASIHDAHIPSASVLVSVNGVVTYARAFGDRDLTKHLAADASTHYEIGSMTKQFTAAAILQLEEAGKLSIDDSVARYAPDAPHARELTLRNLLTQRSGVPEYLEGPVVEKQLATPGSYAKIIATVSGKPLLFNPGSQFRYSNTNYIILGHIVEIVSHETYQHYVRTHEFARAEMMQTAFIADEPHIANMALGYVTPNGIAAAAPVLNDYWAWSAGDIVSTVGDFNKWMAALEAGKIVSASDYALMTSATPATHDSGDTYYDFGLVVSKIEGQPYVWHNGGTLGFRTDGAYFPKQDTRIIVFTNSGDASPEPIALKIFNVLYPDIAAILTTAASGEDVAMTARLKAFFLGILQGKPDRAQMTEEENAHMNDAHIKGLDARLAQLGAVQSFTFKGMTSAATGPIYTYTVVFDQGPFKLEISLEPGTGKVASAMFLSP